MNRYHPNARPSPQRRPLEDATSKANSLGPPQSSKPRQSSPLKPSRDVPRNESLVGNGTLEVRRTLGSPENKRVAKVSHEDYESKRNSAVSATSTNASNGPRKRKTHIGPWQLGKTIGKGGTARVREVRHSGTGQTAVAKIVSKAIAEKARALSLANLVKCVERGDPTLVFGKSMPVGLEREVVIMKLLNHRNIVRLYDVWENRNELYLIMEYVEGGELFDYVATARQLEEDLTVFLFRQIVAALLYCHRIHIHHRDLKPENILLEHGTMTVKLVDFGMAALQPQGDFLTTPCGSPHYAAPELLSSKAYDGSQADVWSCGVVLFVMLTGYPPFNFPPDPDNVMTEDMKLKALFRAINQADYRLPPNLSREAQDLLRRIFNPNPKKRITIEEVWNHKFLHKYNQVFGFSSHRRIESLIGPEPRLERWTALTKDTIDRELFRNLRTLWHSESDNTLIKQLCNKENNQAKYFYGALLKHREEHLETLQQTPGLGYSASDYQHSRPYGRRSRGREDSPPRNTTLERTQSGFSVKNAKHLTSRHSFYELAPSEASYDPFRASREPVNSNANYVNVTIHRGGSSGSRRLTSSAPMPSTRTSSLRVEALHRDGRGGSKRMSRMSNASNSLKSSQFLTANCRMPSRSSSRMSVNSSQWLNSPPIASMRPSDLHKRAVQFSHLRKSSTASALTFEGPVDTRTRHPKYTSGSSLPTPSSPLIESHNIIRSRKENLSRVAPTPRTRKLRDIDQEARKVSTELEQACEEAFFRSSISSSVRTSVVERGESYLDAPTSSVKPRHNIVGRNGAVLDKAALANRPLPPVPTPLMEMEMETRTTLGTAETPNAYTARELAQMRERLAVKYAQEGSSNQKYFNDVLRQLDSLMSPSSSHNQNGEARRAASAPQQASSFMTPDDPNFLHVIPEEGRFADAEEPTSRGDREKGVRWTRSVTEPSPRRQNRLGNKTHDRTIRIVQPSSPAPPSPTDAPLPWAPLNIRKTSNSSSVSDKKSAKMSEMGRLLTPNMYNDDVDAINPVFDSTSCVYNPRAKPPNKFTGLDDRVSTRDHRAGAATLSPIDENGTSGFTAVKKERKSLLAKIFKKKVPKDVKEDEVIFQHVEFGSKKYTEHFNTLVQFFGFGFKPYSRVMPLNVKMQCAMDYITMELLDRFPCVRLVQNKRVEFLYHGEVDPSKLKGLGKPVKFDLECFAIDQNGETAEYSLVRITQTRGAASTLRKVVNELKKILITHGIVVQEKGLALELEGTLNLNLKD